MDTTADRNEIPSDAVDADDAAAPTRDEERVLDDDPDEEDLAELDVPFETPIPDVLDQHREVRVDEERDE